MKRFAMTLAALGLAGSAISPAFAGNGATMTIQVKYEDINLASPEGQKQLDRRVDKAVRTVCQANETAAATRIMSNDVRACLAKARADIRQQIAAATKEQQRGG